MRHSMNLHSSPFCAIKSGQKTIEMRLCDEKRALIKIGDEIEFYQRDSGEKMLTRVRNLTKFKDFAELYEQYDKLNLGYNENEIADPDDMSKYYSKEQIKLYGVLAIEIELI
ncbi:MAG: RNA-binding protein [Clostridia bacterium]|nr:RNA-binding protein [Clostridia bacterium]